MQLYSYFTGDHCSSAFETLAALSLQVSLVPFFFLGTPQGGSLNA